MEDLLLRTCSACLQELSELRGRLVRADAHASCLEARVEQLSEALQSSGVTVLPPLPRPPCSYDITGQELVRSQGLRELCLVQDESLRELLVSACEQGELRIELRDLARRFAEQSGGSSSSSPG
eukprot:CAMPEP_0176004642 /NCGR_PEP_ID=MMETSP0120_2-20121206/1798_1 /TAXON_ID=160619 /ORGANISM="Kryptoperidinium foliaceum, Strain CCMP 1326" /LENGTH=123 /DNA_ID=CAMNT_0017337329 /DNA_START=116 /DNA_END=484 /DNA_ORIENTATION=+